MTYDDDEVLAYAAVILFWVAALNTLLARFAGTCTMGEAGQLWGIVLSGLIALVALPCLWAGRDLKWVWWFLALVLPLWLWHIVFSLQLSYGIVALDQAACSVLHGLEYPRDGSETVFAVLWPVVTIGSALGVFAIWRLRNT